MSETATANPPTWAPWKNLLTWAPFQIDALGLITLLGADEVNASVGRLVRSTWLEYLPLLGAYVIANESFREKRPGYHIYNISEGIQTTDLAPWFSRWIQAQNFEQTRSFVRWTFERRQDRHLEQAAGMSLSFGTIGFLLAMTVLSYDWYGFANALSLFASVLVRTYMVRHLRQAIDDKVLEYVPEDVESTESPRSKHAHNLDHGWLGTPAKVLIITADARAVTMLIPNELLRPPSPFIAQLPSETHFWYSVMRWVGWIAFAVQVVSLGMAQLATQLVTVVLMVNATVLFVSKLGCDDSHWGSYLTKFWDNFSGRQKQGRPQTIPDVEAKSDFEPPHSRSESFEFRYDCWIGKYLKAEIYEWPLNHNYTVDKSKDPKCRPYRPGDKPSEKRQHLYAWLQLSTHEVFSIDKWDLFPHKREDKGTEWLEDYKWGQNHVAELQKDGRGQGIAKVIARATKKPRSDTTVGSSSSSSEVSIGVVPNASAQLVQQQQQSYPQEQPTSPTTTTTNTTTNTAEQQQSPTSPTAPTVTSPEGVVTSRHADDITATVDTAAVGTSANDDELIALDIVSADYPAALIPMPGMLPRQGTGKFSLNSASYVSGEAQDAVVRGRRRSYGELAFPRDLDGERAGDEEGQKQARWRRRNKDGGKGRGG